MAKWSGARDGERGKGVKREGVDCRSECGRQEKKRKEFGRCCFLVAQRPSNMLVYLKDGSALTIVRAATLR